MTPWRNEPQDRTGCAARQKLQAWKHDSRHCRECGEEVSPFIKYCPHCGQGDPARVSPAAVVCLVMGIGVLAITGRAMVILF